jgi:hypothetical protein
VQTFISPPQLENTLETIGRLDVDEYSQNSYYGHTSGIAFLARIQQDYGDLLEPEVGNCTTAQAVTDLPHVFDPPQPLPLLSPTTMPTLPPKATAEKLVNGALEDVCLLSHFIHRPTFDVMLNKIYGSAPNEEDLEAMRFRRLLFAVLAVGSFAVRVDEDEHSNAMATA